MSEQVKKYKKKLVWLYILSTLASVLPVLIVFICRWGEYTKEPSNAVKLALGGAIALVLVICKVVGKLHLPSRIVSFSIVFVLAYLLQSIVQDLQLLSGMALLGEVIDCAAFQTQIKKTKEMIANEKVSDVTAAKIEAVMQRYVGNGRV